MAKKKKTTRAVRTDDEISVLGNSSGGMTWQAEPQQAKRREFFQEMQKKTQKRSTEPRRIASADDLDDDELKKCFWIVDAAVKAQRRDHQPTPEIMEEFFNRVFKDWTSDSEVSEISAKKHLEIAPVRGNSRMLAGRIVTELGTRQVFYRLGFGFEPLAVFTVSLEDEVCKPLGAVDLQGIEWDRDFQPLKIITDLIGDACIKVGDYFNLANERTAVDYARELLRDRAQNLDKPATAEYKYGGAENFWKMLQVFGSEHGSLPSRFLGMETCGEVDGA